MQLHLKYIYWIFLLRFQHMQKFSMQKQSDGKQRKRKFIYILVRERKRTKGRVHTINLLNFSTTLHLRLFIKRYKTLAWIDCNFLKLIKTDDRRILFFPFDFVNTWNHMRILVCRWDTFYLWMLKQIFFGLNSKTNDLAKLIPMHAC